MAGKIIINTERCKGCGLCVGACPRNCIEISGTSNSMGYFPAQMSDNACTGCAMCALMCPDVAIKVMRDSNITTLEPTSDKKKKKELIKEAST
ncbi:MAG: ferredoxin family protein [Sedimentisphaerales bacterium]|nr:ferredoxin family protein [Sedimentisphaerales bacterium]